MPVYAQRMDPATWAAISAAIAAVIGLAVSLVSRTDPVAFARWLATVRGAMSAMRRYRDLDAALAQQATYGAAIDDLRRRVGMLEILEAELRAITYFLDPPPERGSREEFRRVADQLRGWRQETGSWVWQPPQVRRSGDGYVLASHPTFQPKPD